MSLPSIDVSTLPTQFGWDVIATVSQDIERKDLDSLEEWLRSYARLIRTERQFWRTKLEKSRERMVLHVFRVDSPTELVTSVPLYLLTPGDPVGRESPAE